MVNVPEVSEQARDELSDFDCFFVRSTVLVAAHSCFSQPIAQPVILLVATDNIATTVEAIRR